VGFRTGWLLVLAAVGLGLVGWLVWAWEHTEPPPWPVLLADIIAVVGLAVGPWLVLVGRQLVRVREGERLLSRLVVTVAIFAVGGPLVATVAMLVIGTAQPEIAVGLGLVSVMVGGVIALLGGVLLPWLFLLTRTVARERSARVRAEERAEVATHLHDSVLQALTLIQKRADDSRSVRQLARGTERELRSWLYGTPDAAAAGSGNSAAAGAGYSPTGGAGYSPTGGAGYSPTGGAGYSPTGGDLAAEIRAVAEETEDRFDVTVELVAVGTCPLDGPARAVVGAVREALTNAGKHAGTRQVSVFVETTDAELFALVRDRGRGFDTGLIPADRRGIADSIEARLRQRGGTAHVRSTVGAGTEVELRVAR
jgi:signal transduction histidine kinase